MSQPATRPDQLRYCPRCGHVTPAVQCERDGTPTVRQTSGQRQSLGPGDVIGGRYRVLGELGRGGFGIVFDTVHTTTGHPVAVKVLTSVIGVEGQELARRFFQEAATTSRLTHPNTVRVFDFGQTDSGELFLAMERLSGETLQQLLARMQGEGLDEAQVVDIGAAVLRSLGEAHALGLVHRDMKPANIFLHQMAGGEAIVKVLDFGIVKTHDATMTQAGKALGTPTHMSPEQAMGQDVRAPSDLYSLGVVLYECLTGSLPFDHENPLTVVMKHVTEVPESIEKRRPGKVRPGLALVVERALAKSPADRWATAQDMRQALDAAMGTQPNRTGVMAAPTPAATVAEPAPTPHLLDSIEVPAVPPIAIAAPGPIDESDLHGDTTYQSVVQMPVDDGSTIFAIGGAADGDDGRGSMVSEAPRWDSGDRFARFDRPRAQLGVPGLASVPQSPWDEPVPGSPTPWGPAPMLELADVQHAGILQGLAQMTRPLVAAAMPADASQAGSRRQIEAMWLVPQLQHAFFADLQHQLHAVTLGELGHHPVSVLDLVDTVAVGAHAALVEAVCGSPDGRWLAAASLDGVVRLWDVAGGRLLGELEIESTPSSLAIAADGKLLVVGCADGSVGLYELPDLTLRRTLHGHREAVTAVACAGSKRLVVSASDDGMVRTWDPVGGGARLTARAHDGAVACVDVNAAGQMVASGGWDGKLHVWYGRTGDTALELRLHDDIIAGVAVDRTGTLVATAGDDRVVKVVHILSGEVRAERRDFRTGVKHLRFAESGNLLVAGAWDGTFRRVTW